nr:cyclase family protein [Allomuricauda sp.]
MANQNIIDLTMTISNEIPGMHVTPAKSVKDDGWNASTLTLYSHSGTHMDAPWHFEVNNQTVDQFNVNRFFVDAWVVDLTFVKPKELLTVAHLGTISDNIKKGEGLLLRTDWSKKLGNDDYRNGLPRIGEELAKWMVQKNIGMLGVEPPSVADVNNLEEVTKIHQILLGGDIVIVEGLCDLYRIQKPKVKLIALPLKVKNGDGAPARVIAIEE